MNEKPKTKMKKKPETSPTLTKLSAALAAAQADLQSAKKGADNPFFKSKYADLASVVEASKPIAKHGLSVTQYVVGDVLVTRLLHSSGEWIRGEYPIRPVKNDPQGIGSAITYARRYAWQSIIGLPAEDDDGNAASQPEPKKAPRKAPRKAPKVTGEAVEPVYEGTLAEKAAARLKHLKKEAWAKDKGYDPTTASDAINQKFLSKDAKEILRLGGES